MKINSLNLTSATALNFECTFTASICVLHGRYSDLALDLIREVIGDYGAHNDPDRVDDGRFVIHADVEIDDKNYNVCYIRNADFMGDNRIAANFVPNSFEFSEDDTLEFLEKCKARNKDLNNVVYNYKIFGIVEDDRPLFVYCEDADDVSQITECLALIGRQVFIAVGSNKFDLNGKNIQTVFVG